MLGRFFLVLLVLPLSCKKKREQKEAMKIAFLADIHLQDIYAEFSDTDYKGVLNSETGRHNTIRTMGAQLRSTRLFNENYFAFTTALEDIAKRNIKLVVLPGDFTDDGQPMNVRALQKILKDYSKTHGIQFLMTTGNHDPVRPFTQDAGKTDFLGEDGREQAIYSDSSMIQRSKTGVLTPVITQDIKEWGYQEIIDELADFGFYPKKEFLYWETPYSTYSYDDYTHNKASDEAPLTKRVYRISNTNIPIPDVSYLVEPVPGIWLLAIDGNVYVPKENMANDTNASTHFHGASIGYNDVIVHKKHLVEWVRKVSNEAKLRDKNLIAFSHYPMVEFNDGASEAIKTLFGIDKMQSRRIPDKEVAEIFADAGLQIHFGGHMHLNDTGVHTSAKGNTLFNIQTPSLAAYPSAYKILTLNSTHKYQVETVLLHDVPEFNSLFSLYYNEHQHLKKSQDTLIWDKDILSSKNYKDFTSWHLHELIRFRFIPDDWPKQFVENVVLKSGKELLSESTVNSGELSTQLDSIDVTIADFEEWTGFDMVLDFYKLYKADELAFSEISDHRLKQYELLCQQWQNSEEQKLRLWSKIFYSSFNGEPSNNFTIDLKNETIERLGAKQSVISD
ncbi:metallophosphoesterase [Flagellimonas sp. 389]|nr:metallophosphoesterase [Flagellimonas sp. 389]